MRKLCLIPMMVVSVLLLGWGQVAGQKVRFATAVVQPLFHLPFIAGPEKGFWKEQGIEVDWVPFRSATVMYRGVAAGEVDMAMASATSVLQAIIRGVPQKVVADVKAVEEFYFWVRPDSPIKGPRDLKGARIGVTGFGGTMHSYARLVAKALGLEKDVKFVSMGGLREQAAGLRAGATDITVISFVAMAPLKVRGEARELLLVGDFLPKEWSEDILLARNEYAARSPRAVAQAIKGYFKATDFVQANRDWSLEKMKSTMGLEEEVAKAIYPKLRYGREGSINPKALENIVNFLVEYGILSRGTVPPAEKLYDKSFLEGVGQAR